MLYVRYVHFQKPNLFISDKPIPLSERMLPKDYDSNGSVEKNCGREPQEDW
jgi:hypothetical protein